MLAGPVPVDPAGFSCFSVSSMEKQGCSRNTSVFADKPEMSSLTDIDQRFAQNLDQSSYGGRLLRMAETVPMDTPNSAAVFRTDSSLSRMASICSAVSFVVGMLPVYAILMNTN